MLFRILSLLFAVFIIQQALAQKFIPGYYVKSSGDTIKTNLFLQKKGGDINGIIPEGGSLIGPGDVKAAGLNGHHYLVRKVTVDKSPKGSINAVDTIFMEIMSREKISLLYSLDEYDKSHFFIEDENGNVEELGLRVLDMGNGVSFQELPSYKEKLKAIFPGCTSLFDDVDKTRYVKNQIRAVYEKLYECKYGHRPKMQSIKSSSSEFGITAGASSMKLSFEDVGRGTVASSATWDRITNVTGGIFMETRFSRTGDLFSLRQELTYRSYDQTSKDISLTPGISIIGEVSASYLRYNLMGRIALSRGRVVPFINLGIPIGYLLKSNSTKLITNGSSARNEELLGKTNKFELGFFGGAGIAYKDISFETRLEQSSGLDPQNYASKVKTVYLMLSYRLF